MCSAEKFSPFHGEEGRENDQQQQQGPIICCLWEKSQSFSPEIF